MNYMIAVCLITSHIFFFVLGFKLAAWLDGEKAYREGQIAAFEVAANISGNYIDKDLLRAKAKALRQERKP